MLSLIAESTIFLGVLVTRRMSPLSLGFFNVAESLGFFPLRASATRPLRLFCRPCSLVKLFALLVVIPSESVYVFYNQYAVFGGLEFHRIVEATQFSVIDFFTFDLIVLTSTFAFVAYFATFRVKRGDLEALVNDLEAFECDEKVTEASKTKLSRIAFTLLATSVLGVACNCSGGHEFATRTWGPHIDDLLIHYVVGTAAIATTCFFGILSPVIIACGVFQLALISSLTIIVRGWTQKLRGHQPVYTLELDAKAMKIKSDLEELIEVGMKIHGLCSRLEATLAPMICIHLGSSMIIGISSLYGATSAIFGRPTLLSVTFSASFAIWFVALTSFYFCFCHYGQRLEDARKAASDSLDELLVRHSENPSLNFLSKKFSQIGILSPYGFFTVDHSIFLSSFSIGLTYVIVLMQFKQAE